MNICFIGNSVSAQKSSYKYGLSKLLSPDNASIINCTLGGVGSLGISFFINRFVQGREVDLCFIETFVADLGGATPIQYIQDALRGIVENPHLKNSRIVPIYLFRSDVSEDQYLSLAQVYDDVFGSYGITPINIFETARNLIKQGSISASEILYDHIHTTPKGGELYANLIFQQVAPYIKSSVKPNLGTNHPRSILPVNLKPISTYITNGDYTEGRFRWVLPYIEIMSGHTIEFIINDFYCIGLNIIADEHSGVIHLKSSEWDYSVQAFDRWCTTSRLQTLIFPKPLPKFAAFSVCMKQEMAAPLNCHLQPSTDERIGTAIKIVHLMGYI